MCVRVAEQDLIVVDVCTQPVAGRAPFEPSEIPAPRKVQTIERVDGEPYEHLTLRDIEIGRGLASEDLTRPVTPPIPDPALTPVAKFAPRPKLQPRPGQPNFGELPAGIVEDIHDVVLIAHLAGNEIARERIERLMDLREQPGLLAQLHADTPLAVERVDGPASEDGAEVERTIPPKVIGGFQPELQVSRSPILLHRFHDQAGLAVFGLDVVAHRLEVLEPIDRADVPLERSDVERLADPRRNALANDCVFEPRFVLDAHEIDLRRA